MRTDKEKNLIFVGLALLVLVCSAGIQLVDNGLTRLVMPDTPFSTISIEYGHGLVVAGPESELTMGALQVGTISRQEKSVLICIGQSKLRLPCVLEIFHIEKLRSLFSMLTKSIPNGIFFMWN